MGVFPGAQTPTEAEADPLVVYHPLFTSLWVLMSPTLIDQPPTTAGGGIADQAPTAAAGKRRSALQTESCLARHLQACPITLKGSALQHVHILGYRARI